MTNVTPVLEIAHLSKTLGSRQILTDINITLYPGEIFGFLGPNGSGKTTTIKLILGLLHVDVGTISICGHDVKTDFEAAIANVGGIIENPEMYKYLSGRENLQQYQRMYGSIPDERVDEVVRLVRLEDRINDKISRYSLGMRQRLGVAQAILHRPRLLVLDEPTNGLDPAGIKELRETLRELAHREGVTVFVSSHLLAELELMCDRVGVIDRGRVIGVGSMADIHSEMARDGTVSYEIELSNIRPALSYAEEKGWRVGYRLPTEAGENPTAVADPATLPEGDEPIAGTVVLRCRRDEINGLLRAMAAEDTDIYALLPRRKTLEDAFLELTRHYTPGGDQA